MTTFDFQGAPMHRDSFGNRLSIAGTWFHDEARDEMGLLELCASRGIDAVVRGLAGFFVLAYFDARAGEAAEIALAEVTDEAAAHAEARRRMIEARASIARLSGREREVLDWLCCGYSNKAIARELSISPRTVEIHRANMMAKLGARHPAEAVRLKLEAGFAT